MIHSNPAQDRPTSETSRGSSQNSTVNYCGNTGERGKRHVNEILMRFHFESFHSPSLKMLSRILALSISMIVFNCSNDRMWVKPAFLALIIFVWVFRTGDTLVRLMERLFRNEGQNHGLPQTYIHWVFTVSWVSDEFTAFIWQFKQLLMLGNKYSSWMAAVRSLLLSWNCKSQARISKRGNGISMLGQPAGPKSHFTRLCTVPNHKLIK